MDCINCIVCSRILESKGGKQNLLEVQQQHWAELFCLFQHGGLLCQYIWISYPPSFHRQNLFSIIIIMILCLITWKGDLEKKETDYTPESWPLIKTCTAWPVDWTMRVGSLPPRRKDSDEPISTLQTSWHEINQYDQNGF